MVIIEQKRLQQISYNSTLSSDLVGESQKRKIRQIENLRCKSEHDNLFICVGISSKRKELTNA